MTKKSDYEYQCEDCKYARWDSYREMGCTLWEFDRCVKEDEIDEDEACGLKECHVRVEAIEEPYYDDPPYDTIKEKEGLA